MTEELSSNDIYLSSRDDIYLSFQRMIESLERMGYRLDEAAEAMEQLAYTHHQHEREEDDTMLECSPELDAFLNEFTIRKQNEMR